MKTFFGKTSDSLRMKILHHLAGIVLVFALFAAVGIMVDLQRDQRKSSDQISQRYLDLPSVDFGNPVDRKLFRESLELFYPDQRARNDSLLQAIDELRQRQFSDLSYKTGGGTSDLTWHKLSRLLPMYLKFVAVYLVVLIVIYLAAQRIAIYQFVKMKQHQESYVQQAWERWGRAGAMNGASSIWEKIRWIGLPVLKSIGKGVVLVVMFSPAYVIAYSMKTSLDTSSALFMVFLAVMSNGVLIHASNGLFSFLQTESRKGYVRTAIVKNLNSSYDWNTPDGVPRQWLWRMTEQTSSHVLKHIFLNARFQFIPTLKEHASFVVTGLVIIEMALNIQGHLCYELLQEILYRQYEVALVIVYAIFLVVKATEIGVDVWYNREKRHYGYESAV